MEENSNQNNTNLTLPSEPHVGNSKLLYLEGKQWKTYIFTPTSDTRILIRISGHALRWIWKLEGTTTRTPKKQINMRGWIKRIYEFEGATLILNKLTFELWLRSRPYKPSKKLSGTERMIYANWNKADLIARHFSEFAQIALKPMETEHPANIDHAHLVMTTKALNPILKPMSEVKDEVGLGFDKSHPNHPEFMGRKSVEGARGAEWFFVEFPKEHKVVMEAMLGFEEYNKNIKLHLEVLREMRDALKRLEK